MNTNWLIAIDGSTPSLNAVDYVIREAASRELKPQVFLVNVQASLSGDITRIMGTHGLGSVIGLFMGSVISKVVHLTDIPVLLIK